MAAANGLVLLEDRNRLTDGKHSFGWLSKNSETGHSPTSKTYDFCS